MLASQREPATLFCLAIPLLNGVIGAFAVVMFSGFTYTGIAVALAVLVLGFVCGQWSRRRYRAQIVKGNELSVSDNAARQDSSDSANGLQEVCLSTLPIWERHIASARQQTEEAVDGLTRRFAGLVERLEATVAAWCRTATLPVR